MKLCLSDPSPLYIQIYRDLKNRIQNGSVKVGEQLPIEKKLSASYEVSIITVKQAISKLVEEQLVYRRQGKGTFVNSIPKFSSLKNVQILSFGADAFDGFVSSMTQMCYPPYLKKDFCFSMRVVAENLSSLDLFEMELRKIIDIYKVDLLIVFSVFLGRKYVERLLSVNMPVIFLGDFRSEQFEDLDINQITGDNKSITTEALTYLMEKGHRHILQLTGDPDSLYYRENHEAAAEFTRTRGLDIMNYSLPIKKRDINEQEIESVNLELDKLAGLLSRYDAVLMAGVPEEVVLKKLNNMGFSAPENISLITLSGDYPGINCLKYA